MDILKTIGRWLGPRLPPLAVVLLTSVVVHGEDNDATRAHRMKAACIHKFARYIHWPHTPNNPATTPGLSICLLGEDPYDGALQALGSTTDITVRQVGDSGQMTACDMLVIGESEQGRLDQLLQELSGQSVVTISEIDGFTDRGGMIRLYAKNNRIMFDINQRIAGEARLRFDLRLIHLAAAVSK